MVQRDVACDAYRCVLLCSVARGRVLQIMQRVLVCGVVLLRGVGWYNV